MRTTSTLLFLFVSLGHVLAQPIVYPLPKLSAGTRQFLWKMERQQDVAKTTLPEYVYHQDGAGKLYVNALLKIFPGFDDKALANAGVHIGTRAGLIRTAHIPVEKAKEIARWRGIQCIEMDQPMAPELDSARRRTRVDSIHKGLGLSQAYSGQNVVVGIIDAGFDYTHPTLFDTAYQRYRVRRVWEEKNTSGLPPAGFSYGTEWSDSAAIIAKGHDITDGTHGTHVAGIAAGSGWGSTNQTRFRGMAFGSEMVLVAIYPTAAYWLNTGMADMLDGINYTFNYAQSVGKPAVANLSWGCPLGPRDGNSLFSQACDNLTGPGKIFVLSGGNNGQNKIHIKKSFTPTDTALNTCLTFSTSLPQKINQVDVWGDSAQSFCMFFSLYNANSLVTTSQKICLTDTTQLIKLVGTNGDTCFITATAVASEFNGKPHMLLQFLSEVTDRICITVKATAGTVHMWQGIVVKTSGYYGTFTRYSYPWAAEGDVQLTCGDLVSTRSALAVAAYNTKVGFTNVSGQSLSYSGYVRGRIALFSSIGPTADGRTKPNIAGPGLALASSVSSADSAYKPGGDDYSSVVANFVSPRNGNTYSYAMAAGTSMSSPAVSGIVAMLLEANPQLTPQNLMQLLAQTAIVDANTGTIPTGGSNVWGYGKINAYRALKSLLAQTGVVHLAADQDHVLVYPNPGDGHYLVEWLGTKTEEVQLEVYDFTGRRVHKQSWMALEGSRIEPLILTQLPTGTYLVSIGTGQKKTSVRIVRQ